MANVVQTGCNGSEIRCEIVIVKGNDKQRKNENHYQTNHINIYRTYNLVLNGTLVNNNLLDLLRVNEILQFLADALEQNYDTGNLDAAAGASRTATEEQQDYQ